MTKINDISATGASTIYGGGIDVHAGSQGGGSSILEYDSLPKGVQDYLKDAQREYLQRRGDLQRQLAQTDDPEQAKQLEEQLNRLDASFKAFRQDVASGVEAGVLEEALEALPEDVRGGAVDGGTRSTDLNPGMVFTFRAGGPEELAELQKSAESFFDELQSGWDASSTQRIDPPHVELEQADWDYSDIRRAADQLDDDPAVAEMLEPRQREKLGKMLEIMSNLEPKRSSDQQMDKIRG